ncbi:MAG: PTS sugar transporter subunit IIA [Spirochaetales bacterium]
MVLEEAICKSAIKLNLESTEKDEVFEELIEEMVSVNPGLDRREALLAVQEREAKMSTGILPGIAVPHGKVSGIKDVKVVIGISKAGIEYDSLDGKPVHVIILLLSAPESCELHLRVLKHLARLLEADKFYAELLEKKTPQEVYDLICKYEEELH